MRQLNIVKTKDGKNILYDINKIKKADDAIVSSFKGLSRTSTFMSDNISQNTSNVNNTYICYNYNRQV